MTFIEHPALQGTEQNQSVVEGTQGSLHSTVTCRLRVSLAHGVPAAGNAEDDTLHCTMYDLQILF